MSELNAKFQAFRAGAETIADQPGGSNAAWASASAVLEVLDALTAADAQIAALTAQLAEAPAALEPFARHAPYWSKAQDTQPVFTSLKALDPGERDDTKNATIFVSDLRRAAALRAAMESPDAK